MEQNETLSLEQMKDLAWDTYILPAEVIVPLLSKAFKKNHLAISDDRVAEAIETLSAWDYRSGKDSEAYSVLHYWGTVYQEREPGSSVGSVPWPRSDRSRFLR